MVELSLFSQKLPFGQQIKLANGESIAINEIVRVLPNKRLVCKAVWQNQDIYAKLFIGVNAKRDAMRDEMGVQALMHANIATPDLLYAGKIEAGGVLLFKALNTAQNAEVLYLQLLTSQQKPARLQLMLQLTSMVAQMHNANLQQTDLYLKNFLIEVDTVYAIDGDGIKPFSIFFKNHQKKRNLAVLFSKFDALDDGCLYQCYVHYCKLTGASYLVIDYANIDYLTQKVRQRAASRYADKKVFRNCTDVKVMETFKQFKALSRDFSVANLSEQELDDALNNTQNRLKSGNTCTVGVTSFNNQAVVIKRYNIKNFWHGLKLSIFQSRAAKSWANAHWLMLLNVATAKPLALIEERFGCFKRRAYFLSEFMNAPDIAEFFTQTHDVPIKEKVAFETALLFYKLNILHISHGDCKASNIKIMNNKPVLIDLDSMQAHRFVGFSTGWLILWWFEKKHVKDLKRFMQNWKHSLETSLIFKQAFIQVYDEKNDYLQPTILERAKIASTS